MSAITDAALNPRAVWGSERAYVLASIAGIIGLGNLWRFPYMVGQHGGGSFVLAYVVSTAVLCLPLAALESAAGSLVRRTPVGALRRAAGTRGTVIGWAIVGMTVAILSYYLVIAGWTTGYAIDSYRGSLRPFDDFVAGHSSLWWFLVVGVACFVVLLPGVKAIERSSLLVVPVLVVVVVGLAVYAQSLEGASEARSFYFGVSGSALAEPSLWQAAAGQAFYSVGVGQGLLIAYGSFVPAGINLIRSTGKIAMTNASVSVISGLMVFGIVYAFDLEPAAGSELSFTAFPQVFTEVPGGAGLGALFFTLLALAAFTSCLSMFVVIAATVRDELGFSLRSATGATVLGVVALGVPSALSFTDTGLRIGGEPVLDRVDRFTGSGVIVVLGLLGAAALARGLPRRALSAAFGADGVELGRLRLGPHLVIRWAILVPFAAAALYALGSVISL